MTEGTKNSEVIKLVDRHGNPIDLDSVIPKCDLPDNWAVHAESGAGRSPSELPIKLDSRNG